MENNYVTADSMVSAIKEVTAVIYFNKTHPELCFLFLFWVIYRNLYYSCGIHFKVLLMKVM